MDYWVIVELDDQIFMLSYCVNFTDLQAVDEFYGSKLDQSRPEVSQNQVRILGCDPF
jgi:hypothetical protein